nr:MAG TPA: hypothetical protein [Caudoviricetes sp.]DAJ92058.1 MAG TPA: hypothetical protein [Caudoviricetes sp.]
MMMKNYSIWNVFSKEYKTLRISMETFKWTKR